MREVVTDVVIPAYNPDRRLLTILERLASQTLPVRRVHLINTEKEGLDRLLGKEGSARYPGAVEGVLAGQGAPEGGEEALVRRYPFLSVTHIKKSEFDHGGTRNMGVLAAEGADYVVMMTQDAVPAGDTLIESLIRPLEESRVGGSDPGTAHESAGGQEAPEAPAESSDPAAAHDTAGGQEPGTLIAAYARQLPYEDADTAEKLSRSFNYSDEPLVKSQKDFQRLGIKTYFCSNVCAAYRRDLLLELGGFPKDMIFNEDMVFAGRALQAGYRIRYTPEAEVYHSHNYGCMAQFHRNFDLGVSQAQHPEIFSGTSSEGEGMRYVKAVTARLWENRELLQIPVFAARCAFRLAGYRLGKGYEKLPEGLVRRFSSSGAYWDRKFAGKA